MNPAIFIWFIYAFWFSLIAYLIVSTIGEKQVNFFMVPMGGECVGLKMGGEVSGAANSRLVGLPDK